jgi:hypothetical protein
MQSVRLLILFLPFLISNSVKSQDSTGHADISKIPSKYFDAVSKKANTLQQNLDKKSQKVLDRMQKQEAKLQKKLAKIDSLATHNIFSNSADKYNQLKEKLKKTGKLSQYIPKLDTLATSLKFLDQHPEFLNNVKDAKEKLADASEKLNEVKEKLKNAEDIKQFLKERKQYLKEQLEKFGFAKELKKINKEVYYYSQQIKEYKEIFKDPAKAERKAIELLSKTKLFQDFMKKNSMLASLFRTPGDPNDPTFQASLAGLQTRAQVNSLIQNQIAAGGPAAQQQFRQNLQGAQSQLQQLKDKINKLGGGSSDDIMPEGFKPNDQKIKSFFKRLEFGTNIQTQKSTNFFPTISDIGLSLGYKINDKSIIGLGTSFKVGWGTGWNNIHITQQGLAFRSFIDWKLKGTLWISGGYEQNLKTLITRMDQIRDISAWQKSGLIGISKVVSVKSKVFQKTKVQLLWDFLSYEQVPRAQPLIFRIGYNLK